MAKLVVENGGAVRTIRFNPREEAAIKIIQAATSPHPDKPTGATEAAQLAVLWYAEHLSKQREKST